MQLLLQIVISFAVAIPIDWAIQYQAKMMWSATTTGKEPTPYRLGPPKKILAIATYMIAANALIALHPQKNVDLWVILSVGLLILYISYTSYLAIRNE